MGSTIRVEKGAAYRVHDAARSGTLVAGDSEAGITFSPLHSREFALRIGTVGDSKPSTEVGPEKCEVQTVELDPDGNGLLRFAHREPSLLISVRSTAGPGPRLRKSLLVENTGSKPVVLFDVVLDQASVQEDVGLHGGGRGWPVFLDGIGYLAVEFPECENIVSGSRYSLEYYPAITIEPGETYESEPAILEFTRRDAESSLRAYVKEFRLRKSDDLFTYYCSWGAHEYEGPSDRVVDEQIDHVVDLRKNWHVPLEYFILDYGYWSDDEHPMETGRYDRVDGNKRFAVGGLERIAGRLKDAGAKLGMWFGVGCPARKDFVANLQQSILDLNKRYGLKLIKTDFCNWDCTGKSHGHLPGKYMRYQGARNMIDLFAAVKASDPEVLIYATSFAESPWWLKYADFTVVGKEDPSDVPAPSLVDSQILHTDLSYRFFELDAGTYISCSDSHFWCGKQRWRKNLIMSVSRSNQLFLAGELHLLDEDDRLLLERIIHMRRAYKGSFGATRRILGDPAAGEVYGYANTANGRGLVAVFNPSWEARTFEVTASDLGCDPTVRNVCVQLFPDTEVAAIPAEGGHFHAHIDPWEVLWLEVGPSEQHSELLESRSHVNANYPMYVTSVLPPPEVAEGFSAPVEQTYFHTGSTFRARAVIPQSWSGFPLMIDFHGLTGDLYVNNCPLKSQNGAGFGMLYPWTPEQGLLEFGRENLFYVSTSRVDMPAGAQVTFRPVAYFSSSACREDWPHPGDATMVVLIRYLKDGKPYRHSLDPRTAQCAVWLDGIWMEPYRVPPLVPRIWSGFSWAVFMLDLEGDWECVRVLVPKLVDADYEMEFFLTDRLKAAECARCE